MMEDSSSDDDFIDRPGPSTRARVKRKEWPDPDDPGGTSSKKVARSSVSDEHIYSGGVWVSQSCAERTLELSEIM